MSNTAAGFLLDDAVYKNIKEGWNAKLRASSQQLSGLVPFVELYSVFASNDVIFKNFSNSFHIFIVTFYKIMHFTSHFMYITYLTCMLFSWYFLIPQIFYW